MMVEDILNYVISVFVYNYNCKFGLKCHSFCFMPHAGHLKGFDKTSNIFTGITVDDFNFLVTSKEPKMRRIDTHMRNVITLRTSCILTCPHVARHFDLRQETDSSWFGCLARHASRKTPVQHVTGLQ